MEGRSADAIWFPDAAVNCVEESGKESGKRFPLANQEIVLCEAKMALTPELVGQALAYSEFVRRAGGKLRETIVFAYSTDQSMQEAAESFGLTIILAEGMEEV